MSNENIDKLRQILEHYGTDWSKLEVHIEDEKHWITGTRKAARK